MMARVRHKDSKAELALRRALHAAGVRYRLHAPDVTPSGPGDQVTAAAVFVDGDLWHGNQEEVSTAGRESLARPVPHAHRLVGGQDRANRGRDRRSPKRCAPEGGPWFGCGNTTCCMTRGCAQPP